MSAAGDVWRAAEALRRTPSEPEVPWNPAVDVVGRLQEDATPSIAAAELHALAVALAPETLKAKTRIDLQPPNPRTPRRSHVGGRGRHPRRVARGTGSRQSRASARGWGARARARTSAPTRPRLQRLAAGSAAGRRGADSGSDRGRDWLTVGGLGHTRLCRRRRPPTNVRHVSQCRWCRLRGRDWCRGRSLCEPLAPAYAPAMEFETNGVPGPAWASGDSWTTKPRGASGLAGGDRTPSRSRPRPCSHAPPCKSQHSTLATSRTGWLRARRRLSARLQCPTGGSAFLSTALDRAGRRPDVAGGAAALVPPFRM